MFTQLICSIRRARVCRPAGYRRLITMIMLGLLVAGPASANPRPHFITFDVPGALDTGCFSDCSVLINSWNEVTGSFLDKNNVFHGFIRTPDGHITTFDAPGADQTPGSYNGTLPNAINDAGVVTGFYSDANGVSHGFLRARNGRFTTIDVPGFSDTTPIGMNLEGAVVGTVYDASTGFRAFLRRPDGTSETWTGPGACTGTPDTGCYGTGAFSINNVGLIGGHYEDNSGNFVDQGYLRNRSGRLTSFSAPGAGTGPYQGSGCPGCATAVNLFGTLAGIYLDSTSIARPFVRSPWGEVTDIALPGSQGLGCTADCSLAMNDWGTITGSYLDASNVYHGFVRTPDGKLTTFDVPGADLAAGDYNGSFPISINDEGVIFGLYWDANNKIHAFLMCP